MESPKFTPEKAEEYVRAEVFQWISDDAKKAGASPERIEEALTILPDMLIESLRKAPLKEK